MESLLFANIFEVMVDGAYKYFMSTVPLTVCKSPGKEVESISKQGMVDASDEFMLLFLG